VAVAERLRAVLGEPYQLMDREFRCSVSLGIATSEAGQQGAEDVLRDAETALHEAKRNGTGRAVVFDAGMRDSIQRRLALQNDLQRAIDARQLHLVYQPIVSLTTGSVVGCEALARWDHPTLGAISPAQFIPVAEESGCILALGEWALRAACEQYAAWRVRYGDLAPEAMSVNLSRAQLMLEDLAHKVAGILEEFNIEPWRLHLEITETAAVHDAEGAARTMVALRELGVRLDLDDFGTGYSSLASLHQLPIDVIKVDRSFVGGLETVRGSAGLIEAVVSLARTLDLTVIAEGIETPRQLELLQAIGCDLGQGYLFTKPLSAAAFAEFLVLDRAASASAARGAPPAASGVSASGVSATGARRLESRP
jgi:EAL domain-containing protein (putative c-di-GMP-specific phosphodiesterase class I)